MTKAFLHGFVGDAADVASAGTLAANRPDPTVFGMRYREAQELRGIQSGLLGSIRFSRIHRVQSFFIVAFHTAYMKHTISISCLLAFVALAGCAGGAGTGTPMLSGSQQPTAGTTPMPTSAPAAAPLQTATIDGGPAFVNAAQHAVYVSSSDTTNHSNCTSACLAVWPAVPAPPGSLPAPFASFVRSDNGMSQLSYNGSPLYTFVNDTQPDVATGNGLEGFSLARPLAATPAPTSSPAPKQTSTPMPMPTNTPYNPYARLK